ncbi:glycine betaine ABC transporter substrate-binding protein [Rhodococcus sovatensis]|uniref:Glycine betaine ABC transporter substrate-binding protein n=1 Tax=Rhodococcus sovatensis TaxID=1805840 RepID=A0ABZ2PCY6_9NOCA
MSRWNGVSVVGSAPRVLTAAIVALTLAGCAADTQERATIVVGAGENVTGAVLAHIYAGAVRSAGVTAEVKEGLGERSDYVAALDGGEISLVPDFTGDLLHTFDSLSGATEAEDVFVDLNRSLPEGLSVGDYALAEDRMAIAVSSSGPFAEVSSLSDFAPSCSDAVVGIVEKSSGIEPMEIGMQLGPVYGCSFTEFTVYPDSESAVSALDSGEVDALALRTSSFGPLAADLSTLDDDESAIIAQNVVPLMRDGALDDAAFATLGVVAGELTTADLAEMIGEVRSGANSGDVAARWLGEHNL